MPAADHTNVIDDDLEVVAFYQDDVPDSIRALSSIADPDSLDVSRLTTGPDLSASPERWARTALEDVGGVQGQLIWRVILGLRLAWRRSPAHIAGWRIAAAGDNWLRLEAPSWMLTANLILSIEGEHVSLATIVRYDRPPARRIWTTLSGLHRRVSPDLMRESAARVRATQSRPRD